MTSFINDSGEELQYSGDDVLLTKQSATFRKFSIKGDVSVNFTVENNSYNRKVLGYYGFNQVNNPAFSQQDFKLVRNGNEISKGTIVIQEDNGKLLSLFFISGNANWFKLLDFQCNEIRNSALNVQANWTSAYESMGLSSTGTITAAPRDYGIVFPFIDILYKGQKFDEYFLNSAYKSGTGNGPNIAVEIFPALFVKTLVNEIAKTGGIKISGTLLDDKFYNTLIITPESSTLYDPENEEEIDILGLFTTTPAPYLKVSSLAPDMKATEFIKWLCISFGCAPVYDVYSKTLSLNLTDKFNKANAVDWSQYVKSYKINYDVSQNNYIRVAEGEAELYNSINDLKYGELNIETLKTDGSNSDIYSSPFAPVVDHVGDTDFRWATPFIPFFELEDDEVMDYSSVTIGTNSTATFNGSGFPFDSLSDNIIFRVEDDNGIYTGYHTTYSTVIASATTITSKCGFISDSTGKIYTQTINKGTPGARVLSYIPRVGANQVSSSTNFFKGTPGSGNGFTSVATAYFFKEYTPYSLLNSGFKDGLSYGPIDGRIDISLSEKYLKNISNAIKKPNLIAYMELPESVYKSFNFDTFVYLNTGDLNGYFLVESIVNYKDSKTLVEVNIYG